MRAIKRIEIVTHCVRDLDQTVAAYSRLLDYQLVETGQLSEALCAAWDAEAASGLPFAIMQAASRAPVYLRFVETGRNDGYWPPVTQGWIATEILAEDPDELTRRLAGSDFRRIGGPGDLYPAPKSPRAMQTMGPSGELIYFTRIVPGGSRFGLKGAKCFVDRPFIMVMGAASLDEIYAFYQGALNLRVSPPTSFVIGQMSRVLGVHPGTAYPVALARLPGRSFLLECEQLPAGIERRPRREGHIPDGLAMVGFASASLDALSLNYRAPPRAIDGFPYKGRRVAVVEGPGGEWLELID